MAVAQTELRSTTPDRILDAAFAAVLDFGLSRLTMEDVAQRAGLSRQTVYRYFPSKDHLFVALVSREEEKFLDGVRSAFVEHGDLATAVRESVTFVLAYAKAHPLLDRLLGPDEGTFLPYVTTRAQPVIVRARETMVRLLVDRVPQADVETVRTVLDGTTRALISYMLAESDRSPHDIASAIARLLVALLSDEEVPS
jgi:AcrR family transcriptional regulator